MNQVIIFPIKPAVPRPPPQRHRGQWKFADLNGERPCGHPKLEYGPKGRVILALHQVWVEVHTKNLVVIMDLYVARKGFYAYDVVFAPYQNNRDAHCVTEAGFRQGHEVWDTFGESQRQSLEKLDYLSAHDPTSPFYGLPDAVERSRAFFGFDAKGNKKD